MAEINYKEAFYGTDTFRIDPEYFNRAALKTLELIGDNLQFGDLVKDGYRVVYETTEAIDRAEGEKIGLPYFLQAANIETPFIDTALMVCVAESDWERYPKGRIQSGELLIEVKGKAEKIALVPDNFPKKTLVTGTCFKVTTINPVDRYFLAAYLTCKHGQVLKERLKTNLLISYLAKDDLYRLPIPDVSMELKDRVKVMFDACFKKKQEAELFIQLAEKKLLQFLGLENWRSPEPLTYVRNSSEAFAAGRLDAEHFQEANFALRELLTNQVSGFRRLGELALGFTNGAEIREYQPEGTPYLRVGDIKHLSVDENSVLYVDPVRAEKELQKVNLEVGDVLVSRSGSLAVTAVVEPEWAHALISSHLIRVRIADKDFDPYYVALFLSTMPGKMQIKQWSNGGVQPEINQPSLAQIVVPKIPRQTQQEIREAIFASREKRQHAAQLLEAAKRAVEIAIEQSEAEALAYLHDITASWSVS